MKVFVMNEILVMTRVYDYNNALVIVIFLLKMKDSKDYKEM